MRKIIATLFNAVFFLQAGAQLANISGRVVSATKQEPLPGVSVIIDHSNTGTTTDTEGNYSLAVPMGKHSVTYRMIGMKEKTENVDLAENENKILIILLEEQTKELGVVVVSASKYEQKIEEVTVSMNVIRPALVENRNTTTMDELIDQAPSVCVMDGQANIRGGSGWSYGAGSRVLILVDDLPMLTADAGDAKWNFLPLENLEQIEVIKGAASALYGSSALNGVINVRTTYPKATPLSKVIVHAGIYDTNQKLKLDGSTYNLNWSGRNPQKTSGFSFLHSRQIKNLDVVLGGNLFLDDGYKEGEFDNRGRINCNLRYRSKKIDGLSYGVNMNTMVTKGILFFIWQNDTAGAYRPYGGLDTATTTLSEYTTRRTHIDPFITYFTKKGNLHKLRMRYFRTNNENNTNQESKADVYYGEYQFQKKFSDNLTITGGLVATNTIVNAELYQDHTGSNYAGYLQGDVRLLKNLIASAGARVEQNQVDSLSDKLTPVIRAGLNYRLFNQTYLRASYGQGYRYPAVAERFVRTSIGALTIYPNDSLESEKGFSAEAGVMQGIRLGNWKGYIDVAAFYTEYRNMIEFTYSQWEPPAAGSFGIGFKALNIGNTRIKGLDVSLSGDGEAGPLHITLLAGYTYMVPEVIEYDSNYIKAQYALDSAAYLGSDSSSFLKYRFNHMFKGDLELGYKRISLGISARYNSFMKNIDKLFVSFPFGEIISPGVKHYRENRKKGDLIFDARAAFQISQQVKLAFIVKNVCNYIYMQRPTDMQPPRTFTGQLTVSF